MNANVKRIVDALFEDIEESEEVCAIRDEVMNNCQERYENLVFSGYSEDEAVSAVIESLRGMDEVLKDYPRKETWTEADFSKDPGAGAFPEDETAVAWNAVRALKISVRGADVRIYETNGREEMNLRQGTDSRLVARVEGDTLVIAQERRESAFSSQEAPQDLFASLRRLVSAAVGTFGSGDDCAAEIGVPAGRLQRICVQTLSGDIRCGTGAREMTLQTTSGDLEVEIPERYAGESAPFGAEELRERLLKASSISGDVDVRGTFSGASLSTTSGDIDFCGGSAEIRLSTVSGDIDADTVSDHVTGSTVSGDIEMRVSGGERREVRLNSVSGAIHLELTEPFERIEGNAVSGDVRISVPMRKAHVGFRSVTGPLRTSGVSIVDEAPPVSITSVSGGLYLSTSLEEPAD